MDELKPAWESVRRFMRRHCGVVLSEDQSYLLDSRLSPVARELRYASVESFVQAACAPNASQEVVSPLIDAMTTHETSFFRDRGCWSVLQAHVLPAVLSSLPPGQPLRVWSAACSTGQEAYSMAMLLEELYPEVAERAVILASDISHRTVDRARAGRFSLMDVNRGLGAARMLRYLEQCGAEYQIQERLRRRIQWFCHNLLGSLPGPIDCHIVLCRNVLIYFDEVDRASAIRRIRESVSPYGFIGVGCTELLRGQPIAPGWYLAASAVH